MKTKYIASAAVGLSLIWLPLIPIAAQATGDCNLYLDTSCEYDYPDQIFQAPGHTFDGAPKSITLANQQSRVVFTLIQPGATWLEERSYTGLFSNISCRANDENYFDIDYSSTRGSTYEVMFDGQPQTLTTSVTPLGIHSFVTVSFAVPQFVELAPYSCETYFEIFDDIAPRVGDGGYAYTLNLLRAFTPSRESTTAPPSTATPSSSSSPRVTSSSSPSASAQSNDEQGEVDTRPSEVVVGGTADSESGASPIGLLAVGILSAFAGIGATVAFIQRKAITRSLAKFKRPAKP
jgi:hypothetical protein